jgi:hypothetical protein
MFSIMSHLFADTFFGYVPVLWPLQPFRAKTRQEKLKHKHDLGVIKLLEVLSILYMWVGTDAPRRVGVWAYFVVTFAMFVFGVLQYPKLKTIKQWLRKLRRREENAY